ncbi:MAG: phosphoribosylaminoimidazolesuccinocarboxamide synthase [Bacteroidetes bacterium]|nr:MAG: phosphoribosylaminoimidazolesuccinocarboxamide synthase [Bacteroidota bacterium]
MNRELVQSQIGRTLDSTDYKGFDRAYKGKVRDTYVAGDKLLLITTDRISAFDHILRQTIPFKGQVLNQLAAFHFKKTADIIQNHVLSIPDPNVTVATLCEALPVEFVVRGYLAGHAWRTYLSGGRLLCGETLPDGLKENSALPYPILTPATKAESGHDEDISVLEIIERDILTEESVSLLKKNALALFARGTEVAKANGLILVDTKYEFGRLPDGSFIVIDEIHTADSSRYFYADSYQDLLAGDRPQRQLSKEFVREWLMNQGFQGLDGQQLPDLDVEFVEEVSLRYIELYEKMTGGSFVPDTHPDPVTRISEVINHYRS